MIPVEIYKLVYFVFLTLLLVVIFLPSYFGKSVDSVDSTSHKFVVFALLILTISFIGLRDPGGSGKYLGDTKTYTRIFESIKYDHEIAFNEDKVFFYFMKFFSGRMEIGGFYLLCAFIYVLLPYLAFRRWFRSYTVYVLITYITAFSFLGFGINGLRNGLASSIFIFGLAFFDKKWLMYFFLVLSVGFHKGMLLPLFGFFMSAIVKSPKKLVIIWLISVPLSYAFAKNMESFALLVFGEDTWLHDDRAQGYFSGDYAMKKVAGQFRIDFIIYSAVGVFLGYWAIVKKGFNDTLYRKIWSSYVIANSIWIWLTYVPYTNRIAYLSWFIMPVILTAPFISEIRSSIGNNKIKLFYVMYGSLAFTILMEVI